MFFRPLRNVLFYALCVVLVLTFGETSAQPAFDENTVPGEGETLLYRVGTTYSIPIVVNNSESEVVAPVSVSAIGLPMDFYVSGRRESEGEADINTSYLWTPSAEEVGTYQVMLHASTSEDVVSTRSFTVLVLGERSTAATTSSMGGSSVYDHPYLRQ